MKVVGLTGGTGSGKGVVSRKLEQAGAYVVDADVIAHEIIEKGKPAYLEIVEYYGRDILDAEENIIRRKLGEIVFHDAEKLAFLNRCTHKYINAETERQIAQTKQAGTAKAIILDAPLLLEAGLDALCDRVWVVYADSEVRAKRIMARDNVTYELAKARIGSQKSWEEYKKAADAVIDNSGDVEGLDSQLQKLLEELDRC